MLIIDCHFYVEIYFACLHVQLFNFILYFVQFFVAYWSGLVQSHSSKCNENATPLQSIQLRKCNPIQQHIPISLLTGSNTPPSRDILFYLQSVYGLQTKPKLLTLHGRLISECEVRIPFQIN